MAIIRWPPGLAVGHQRREVVLERLIVELGESLGIVEILAPRIGGDTALVKDIDRERLRPPVAVGAAEQRSHRGRFCHRTAHRFTGLRVHDVALLLQFPETLGLPIQRRKRTKLVSETGKID